MLSFSIPTHLGKTMWGQISHLQTRKSLNQKPNPAGTLNFRFPATRTVRKKFFFVSFSCLVCGISCAVQACKFIPSTPDTQLQELLQSLGLLCPSIFPDWCLLLIDTALYLTSWTVLFYVFSCPGICCWHCDLLYPKGEIWNWGLTGYRAKNPCPIKTALGAVTRDKE